MAIHSDQYVQIKQTVESKGAVLVAVSKKKSVEEILALYQLGQRDFGENYVQELVQKQALLPTDIKWHFIGHLQRNKVKLILPHCSLIQGVDRVELLEEIDKQAARLSKKVDCLLQVHIATEDTKFGFDATELTSVFALLPALQHVRVIGFMGMASFTENSQQVRNEFGQLHALFKQWRPHFPTAHPVLSMGMSGDYQLALEEGSTMIRIGSLIFGARQ